MKQWQRWLCGAALCGALAGVAPVQAAERPGGDAWLQHVTRDLLPFWAHPDALGQPPGNFPTFRCNDGRRADPAQLCDELAAAPGWVQPEIGRDYVRMQARQTYLYGVAFHLTGDRRWLDAAWAGARHTMRQLESPEGVAAWYREGRPGIPVTETTAQDQAYAVVGIAMLYYLTRDPALERVLVAHQKRVFAQFWDDELGMLRWVPAGGPADEGRRLELVAQLDQLNAYMLLVTPYLPDPVRAQWRADIRRVVDVLMTRFRDPATGRFWGTLEQGAASRAPGARHNDFGHTIKAWWMILLAARELGDTALEAQARRGAERVLAQAWHAPSGAWASSWRAEGVEAGKSWWIYAELDQAAATLAMDARRHARYLVQSGPFWMQHFVDARHGEVWGGVGPQGEVRPGSLKLHHWKNGYHSFEHALVGYLSAQALDGRTATLHFASGRSDAAAFRPYLFRGRVVSVRPRDGMEIVTFRMPAPR